MSSRRIRRDPVDPGARPGAANRRAAIGVMATGTLAGVLLAPATASAASGQPLAGTSIICGDHVLTFTGGVQVGDLHRVRLGNGNQVVINDVVLHGATLTDESGTIYRAVGSANSTAHVVTEGDPENVTGHFNVNITVLGDNGRVASLRLRERISADGTVATISGGDCSF